MDGNVLSGPPSGLTPRTVRFGAGGRAVLFRFGVGVGFGLTEDEERQFVSELCQGSPDPFPEPEQETASIRVSPDQPEQMSAEGPIVLREASPERLQVVAEVLAKSTVLAYYERRVANVFDRVEKLARQLQQGGKLTRNRDLLRELGDVLVTQARTVGRAEVGEKPEITWDHPDLDRLYERLALEYELRDRDRALERKLQVIANTAQTVLDLLQHRQTLRVEWYIVILIVLEIGLSLYALFRVA